MLKFCIFFFFCLGLGSRLGLIKNVAKKKCAIWKFFFEINFHAKKMVIFYTQTQNMTLRENFWFEIFFFAQKKLIFLPPFYFLSKIFDVNFSKKFRKKGCIYFLFCKFHGKINVKILNKFRKVTPKTNFSLLKMH